MACRRLEIPVVEALDATRQRPRDIDGRLLTLGRKELGRDLGPEEKQRIRKGLIEGCRARLAEK